MTDKTEVSEQIRCSVDGCDLEIYPSHGECILHYIKSTDNHNYQGFPSEREAFYGALKRYIEEKTDFSACSLEGIHFPRPDNQGKDYTSLLNLSLLHFKDCHFYGGGLELKEEVFFDGCEFHNKWSLFDYKLLNADNVIYSHCIFKKDVDFNPIKFTDENNREALDKTLSQSQFNYYCKFEGQLIINNAIIKKNIFNDNQNNFLDNNFGSEIIFNGCTFEDNQELYLSHNDKTDFLFDNCYFGKKLKIRSVEKGNYEEQQKNKAKLKSLKLIDCNADKGCYLRVGFLDVENFELSNLRLPQNSELNIGDCHFKNFKLSNFRNIGKFKFYKINILKEECLNNNKFENECIPEEERPNKLFQIDNTSIGKTDFQSVNLPSFEKVAMFDNIFTEIDYTNVKWEQEIEVGQFGASEKTEIAKKRDTYRTLKSVASRNNDQPQAIQFFAKEMGCYHQLVKNNKEYSLSDRATLWFNKHTNNFGLSFWMPLGWLSVLSILFYILLLHLLPISLSLDISGDISKFFARFFIFLNPIHKVKDVFGGDWDGLAYAIDFIFRIGEGLLIYQTAQAFRKYSRKL